MAIAAPPTADTPVLTKSFYSPSEVAEIASVSSSTILNYIKAGKLPAVRLSERTFRIPRKAVVRLLGLEATPPLVTHRPNAQIDF